MRSRQRIIKTLDGVEITLTDDEERKREKRRKGNFGRQVFMDSPECGTSALTLFCTSVLSLFFFPSLSLSSLAVGITCGIGWVSVRTSLTFGSVSPDRASAGKVGARIAKFFAVVILSL